MSLTVGSSAQRKAGCSSPSCAHLRVQTSGFAPGARVACHSSVDGGSPFYTYTASASRSEVCYFGYPGAKVWVVVDGIRSNTVTWPGGSTPTTPRTTPSRSVTISKGASAQGRPGCTVAACARIRVQLDGIAPGATVACHSSVDGNVAYYTYTASSTVTEVCYFGFPGESVWVLVDGVRSSALRW